MIKVLVKEDSNAIKHISINGHADYSDYGKDIICASASAIIITTVNSILHLEPTITYEENDGKVAIEVIKNTEINTKLIGNMLELLQELERQYPKNINIRRCQL